MRLARLVAAVAAAFITTSASAGVVGTGAGDSSRMGEVLQIRLVCDQYCNCWKTRYVASARDDRARRAVDVCPGGGTHNGYYRKGPAAGLNFEGRFPLNSFPF